MPPRQFALTLALTLVALLAGCASLLPEAHKIEVQQGTLLDPEAVARIEPGMTRDQVRFLLGNPTITDVFHPNRWDYLHMRSNNGEQAPVSRLTLFFSDDDKLVRIEDRRDPAPADKP